MDDHRAKIAIPAFADPQQRRSAPGGALPGHHSDPRREFAIVLMGVAGGLRVVIGLVRKGEPGVNRYGDPP